MTTQSTNKWNSEGFTVHYDGNGEYHIEGPITYADYLKSHHDDGVTAPEGAQPRLTVKEKVDGLEQACYQVRRWNGRNYEVVETFDYTDEGEAAADEFVLEWMEENADRHNGDAPRWFASREEAEADIAYATM